MTTINTMDLIDAADPEHVPAMQSRLAGATISRLTAGLSDAEQAALLAAALVPCVPDDVSEHTMEMLFTLAMAAVYWHEVAESR